MGECCLLNLVDEIFILLPSVDMVKCCFHCWLTVFLFYNAQLLNSIYRILHVSCVESQVI